MDKNDQLIIYSMSCKSNPKTPGWWTETVTELWVTLCKSVTSKCVFRLSMTKTPISRGLRIQSINKVLILTELLTNCNNT